tara:strand:- start:136 stop:450 length:315 start_codon:yes stop_codon:yes gene_type:complete
LHNLALNLNSLNSSDPNNADHHWFSFLRYQQELQKEGKESTITGWLKFKGLLQLQEEYEAAKNKALNKMEAQKQAELSEDEKKGLDKESKLIDATSVENRPKSE